MILSELKEAVDKIDSAVHRHKDSVTLTTHRLEQINRILKYAKAHWDELEAKVHYFLYPERK